MLYSEKFCSHVCIRSSMQLSDLLNSRVECPDFLEKLESGLVSVPQIISGSDLDQEKYVLFRQEDIVEGIACFSWLHICGP